jgi:SAM-dependent MidA family methyltransferase
MTDFRPADHAMGLELQLEELQEQQQRARVQGRAAEVERLQDEMEELQTELAATSEMIAGDQTAPEPPHLHDAEKLSVTDD